MNEDSTDDGALGLADAVGQYRKDHPEPMLNRLGFGKLLMLTLAAIGAWLIIFALAWVIFWAGYR